MDQSAVADASWGVMLDTMQQSLARILTGLEDRERSQNFAAVVAVPSGMPAVDPDAHQQLTQAVALAEQHAAEADAGLQDSEHELRLWLDMANTVRQTLVNCARPGV